MNSERSGAIRSVPYAAVALIAVAVAVVAAIAMSPAPAGAGNAVTPITATLIPQKEIAAVRGSDGRLHAVYELQLTNTGAHPATLESVQIVNARGDRVLHTYEGDELLAEMRKLDREPPVDNVFPGQSTRILFVSLAFDSRKQIPRAVRQTFTVETVDPFSEKPRRFEYTIGRARLADGRPPIVSPPLEGQGWFASQGCCGAAGHVSAMFGLRGKLQAAERYAIDWIKVAPDGRIFHGDKSDPANWVGYGEPVRSMSGGRVTTAVDDQQDQTPGVKPADLDFAQLPGNNVVIKRHGFSYVYAHLKPGSVAVEVGDRVEPGTPLGKLGNTGGTLAPHLHVHLVNGPNASTSDGYPYALDRFKLAAVSDIEALGKALDGEAGFPTREQMDPVGRRNKLPLTFTIDDFPAFR